MKQLRFLLMLLSVACPALASVEKRVGERTESLSARAWDASEWISARDAQVVRGRIGPPETSRSADGASWFVTDVSNDREVVKATWMTSALGVYELYVNGRPVGDEFLKPGFTHYKKTKYSFTYDVTDAIGRKAGGRNRFAAAVTPGWWADRIVTPNRHEGMVGKKPAFRSVLELEFADGSTRLVGTDTLSWKAGVAGPVTHAGIFDGETYDARIPAGYLAPDKLGIPEVNREFPGEIVPSAGAEVYLREDLALRPVQAYTWSGTEGRNADAHGKVLIKKTFPGGCNITLVPGDTLVVDFGQNAAAIPVFDFRAAEGTRLTCLPGELLNDGGGAVSRGMDGPEGSVYRINLRIPDYGMRLEYTFGRKKGYVTYHPHFSYFGYRYLSVTATGKVHIRSIRSVPVSSITADMESGRLSTGYGPVNQLISNTWWSQLSNYLSVPTDCPQRNERLGWTADTQVFAETGSFFANTAAFLRKWMRDMRDSQTQTGAFPSVAPVALGGRNSMRFGWSDAGIIVPWTVWKQFADVRIIDENWEAMCRYMQHVSETKYSFAAVRKESKNQQYADWLSFEPLETSSQAAFIPGVRPTAPKPETIVYWDFLGGCYWAMDARMMRDMALATGRDTAVWEEMHSRATAYLKERFLDEGTGVFKTEILNTMQTPALFALRCNLLEGQAREAMKERLRENFAAHGNCLQTGFLGTSILMQTLTENGMADLAWDLLFQRRNPSWLYSVDNGATTIWERWNSYTRESGVGLKGMNSFNHYAYGCVCQWIWESAAGISADIANPGFRHIILKPVPDKRLGYIEAAYNSVAGLIKSAWRYEGDTWIWDFTIPEGVTASVYLPGAAEARTYTAGTYRLTRR